jgi:hypothetical protein
VSLGLTVYEFPAEYPFKTRLRRRTPSEYRTGNEAPWRLVRQGLTAAEVIVSDLTREDMERLAAVIAEELSLL